MSVRTLSRKVRALLFPVCFCVLLFCYVGASAVFQHVVVQSMLAVRIIACDICVRTFLECVGSHLNTMILYVQAHSCALVYFVLLTSVMFHLVCADSCMFVHTLCASMCVLENVCTLVCLLVY